MRVLWTLFAVLFVCDGKGGRSGGRGSSRNRFSSFGRGRGSPGPGGSYTTGFSLLGLTTRASRSYSNFRNSLRSSMRSGALHAAGLIIIANPTIPFYYGGNYYYWSHSYYDNRDIKRPNRTKCQLNVNETQELNEIYFDDEKTRPEVVIWECKQDWYCCGVECCSEVHDRKRRAFQIMSGAFFVIMIVLTTICCIGTIKDMRAIKYETAPLL